MRTAVAALIVLIACRGDGADWDGAVADFEEGLCTSPCQPHPSEAACRVDAQTNLADAKAMLDPAGEQRCIDCLDTKLRLFPLLEMQSCQPTTAQQADVIGACGENDEACAGRP